MKSSRILLIGGAVAIIVGAAIGVGIWFGTRKSDSNEPEEITFLLHATNGSIITYNPKNLKSDILVEDYVYGITAFDYYGKNTIYYATTKPNEPILSSSKNYPSLTKYTGQWTKTALAVDYVSEKIYVIDGLTNQLNVIDLEDRYYGIVLSNLNDPKDVVLDPFLGYLFILQESSILQATMNGHIVNTIIKDESNLKAISIDCDNEVIYFATSDAIMSYSYKFGALEKVIPLKINVLSLAVTSGQLYILHGISSEVQSLQVCLLANNICVSLTSVDDVKNVQSIKIYKTNRFVIDNPCNRNNGGCHHLCMLTRKSDTGRSCECNVGWELNDDSITCDPVKKYLLYLQDSDVHTRIVDPKKNAFTAVNSTYNFDFLLKTTERVNFDYNPRKNYLIFAHGSSINYVNLETNANWNINLNPDCYYIPVVDWITNILYYIQNCNKSNKYHIAIRGIEKHESEKVIYESDGIGESIAIDPNNGLIFFTAKSNENEIPIIYSCFSDGSKVTSHIAVYGHGLTIDPTKNILYTLDKTLSLIYYVNIDELNDSKWGSYEISAPHNPETISVYENWLYISNKTGIWASALASSENSISIIPDYVDKSSIIHGVKIITPNLQYINKNHPCLINNGGCDHYCIAVPSSIQGTLEKMCIKI